MKKIIVILFVFLFYLVGTNVSANVVSDCKSCILLEARSKKVLYSDNEHEKLSPASMTKIMTLTLVFEAINDNRLSLDEYLVASAHAKSMDGSKIFLDEGEKMIVVDLIKSVAIASANDAAVVLAEKIAGSEELFVDKMNEYVKNMGLTDTNFVDCTGLTEENHYSSSYDMAMMSINLIEKYPQVLEYTSIYDTYITKEKGDEFWLVNTNKLLKQYDGIDGLKTGYTSFSGYCLSSTISKNGMRLVGVIMGSSTSKARNEEMIKLFNYGLSNYRSHLYLKKGESVYYCNDIKYSSEYSYVLKNDINILSSEKIDESKIRYELEINGIDKENYIYIYYDSNLYLKEELIINTEIKESNYFDIIKKIFMEMFKL